MHAAYYDGRSARRHEVALDIVGGELVISGDFGERRIPLADVAVGERFGGAGRRLGFADGATCDPADAAEFELLLASSGWQDGTVARVQHRWPLVGASLAGFIGFVALVYFAFLPWFAAFLAPRLPEAFAATLATHALKQLDESGTLRASGLPAERQQAIAARMAALQVPQMPAYRLHFRAAPRIGANAFALPDGQVVLLDELVAAAENDEQVVAVLAHELAHVHFHHGLRQMIQGAVVSFVAAAWFGDVSSLAAGFGAAVLESRYSRGFEREADAWAAGVLRAGGSSAEPLARMLERLEAAHRGKGQGEAADWLSSHPDVAERVAALRAG